MPGVSKIIKNRIKSVNNAKNITKAMELVAAAKIKKAVSSLMGSRAYAKHAIELLANLSKEISSRHPLLKQKQGDKELLIIVASNRGLCGGYNVNILKIVTEYIKKNKDKTIDIIAVGRKAEIVSRHTKANIIASFVKFPDDLYAEDIAPLSKMVIDEFINNDYEKVSIAFTNFISGLKYEPMISGLLPITRQVIAQAIGEKEVDLKRAKDIIIFEPDKEKVLDLILPRLTETRIYQSLLESNASEHSARMVAMKNATDNAKDIVDELTLYYNQQRQASITQEIAEISAGAEALS